MNISTNTKLNLFNYECNLISKKIGSNSLLADLIVTSIGKSDLLFIPTCSLEERLAPSTQSFWELIEGMKNGIL